LRIFHIDLSYLAELAGANLLPRLLHHWVTGIGVGEAKLKPSFLYYLSKFLRFFQIKRHWLIKHHMKSCLERKLCWFKVQMVWSDDAYEVHALIRRQFAFAFYHFFV